MPSIHSSSRPIRCAIEEFWVDPLEACYWTAIDFTVVLEEDWTETSVLSTFAHSVGSLQQSIFVEALSPLLLMLLVKHDIRYRLCRMHMCGERKTRSIIACVLSVHCGLCCCSLVGFVARARCALMQHERLQNWPIY